MIPLEPRAETCLKAAGWHRNRIWAGLEAARSDVEAQRHRMSGVAFGFLKEFGGLLILHPSLGETDTKTAFDPVEGARQLPLEWLWEYERRAGSPLSVVGEAFDGHMAMLIADDGRVFLAYDDEFQCIGDDALDALNWLCVGPSYHAERARRHLNSDA